MTVNNYAKTSEIQMVYRLSCFQSNPVCENNILPPFFLIHRTPVAITELLPDSSLATFGPNPSFDYITIRTNEPKVIRVALLDLSGRAVMQADQMSGKPLFVGHLPPSCYLVNVHDNEGRLVLVQKLMIVR